MVRQFNTALFAILLLLLGHPSVAEPTSDDIKSLQEEVSGLKKGQEAMQKDLAEIKKLLEQSARPASPPPFKPTEITLKDPHFLGKKNAPVTIVEFSDYQCPFCSRHSKQTMPELTKDYIDTGKVKFVMRENPLGFHKNAMGAAQAALCAGDQGKYFEMHDLMFADQKKLAIEDLKASAATLGLNTKKFDACLDEGKNEKRIKEDLAEGRKLGIKGTPGFVLGLTDPKNSEKVKLTKFINGAQSYDNFKTEIEELLKSVN